MNELTLKQVQELYDHLTGKKSIDGIIIEENYNLTKDQAFGIIYILQEHYKIIPDHYEQCDHCGDIYDSKSEGHNFDCEDCDGCYYCEKDYPCTENFKVFINYKHFCCDECERAFIVDGGF